MVRYNIYRDCLSPEFDSLEFSPGKRINENLTDVPFSNALLVCDGMEVDENFLPPDGGIVCVRVFPSGGSKGDGGGGGGGVMGAVKSVGKVIFHPIDSTINLVKNVGQGFFSGGIKGAIGGFTNWIGGEVSFATNTVGGLLSNFLGTSNSSVSTSSVSTASGAGGSASSQGAAESIPSIKGGKNQSILGRPVPIILGKSLLTPAYAGMPYTLIGGTDGEDQYYYSLLVLGYKDIEAVRFRLGELDVASNSEKITDGYLKIDGNPRFRGILELELASEDRELELYPQKVVQENVSFQLLHPDDSSGNVLVSERFSATYPQKIQVEVSFNSLLHYDDNGSPGESSVTIRLEISFDGGKTYSPFGMFSGASSYDPSNGNSTFRKNKNKAMRFIAERTLSYSEAMGCLNDTAQIRIQRVTPESTDSKYQDRCYCTGIRTWVFDKEKSKKAGTLVPQSPITDKIRGKTVRLAMRMKASDMYQDLNGTINQLSCIATSKCRVWNGSAWSDTEEPTNNPAAVALKLMQSPTLSNRAYPDERIDLERFGELYEFCEEKKLFVGGVLASQKKLSEVVDIVLAVGRGLRVTNGAKYSVVIDKPREYPVTVLNNHNFLDGEISNSKEFRDLPDGFRLSFINERLNYAQDELFCMMDGKSADDPEAEIETVEVQWETDPEQVWRKGRYELAKRKLRPESWTRKVGIEGNLIEIGSMVSIQDDTILVGIGDGGEVTEVIINGNYITGIKIDGVISVSDIDNRFAVKVVHSDVLDEPTVSVYEVSVPIAGDYSQFSFLTPIYVSAKGAPFVGDLISFGIYGRETIDALCMSKTDNGDETFTLSLSPYAEGVYTADTAAIPEFDSKVTNLQSVGIGNGAPPEYATTAELAQMLVGIESGTSGGVDPDIPTVSAKAGMSGITLILLVNGEGLKNTPKSVTWTITRPDGSTAEITDNVSAEYEFDRNIDGYPEAKDLLKYKVKGKLTNVYGKSAESPEVGVDTEGYGTWIPLVADLTAQRIVGRTATLSFGQKAGRLLYGETRYKLAIRKGDEVDWFDPDLTSDPYKSVDAYKGNPVSDKVDEGLNTTHTFTQTLPLDGQNDVVYYESWWYTTKDKKDAYGNPVQQSARTEPYLNTPPHGRKEEDGNPSLKDGTGAMVFGDSDKKPFGAVRLTKWEVYGEITGEGTGEEDVCVIRYQGELYEVLPEFTKDGITYQISGGQVSIDGKVYKVEVWNSVVTIDGKEYPVSGTVELDGMEFDAKDLCDDNGIFSARRHAKFYTESGANPRDTLYEYMSTAYVTDPVTGKVVHQAEGLHVFVTALATSAADVVNSAISHNKLAPGAVQMDNLAAGCITADKMAVRDLFAICGVFGRIQDNEITDAANNFWNLETGQFLLSNGVKDVDGYLTDLDSEYFAYTPRGCVQPDGTVAEEGSFWFKIANFSVSAISSRIKGIFRVQRTSSEKEKDPLLTVNPTNNVDSSTGTPAKSIKVNGNVDVNGPIEAESINAKSVGLGVIDAIYPVGSVYMTMTDISPSVLFPGTKWNKVEGRFLLATDEDHVAGSIGGEAEHTLTEAEIPSHTHSMDGEGSHTHAYDFGVGVRGDEGVETTDDGYRPVVYNEGKEKRTSTDGYHAHTIHKTGGGEAHNNMPPFLAVNIYTRIA